MTAVALGSIVRFPSATVICGVDDCAGVSVAGEKVTLYGRVRRWIPPSCAEGPMGPQAVEPPTVGLMASSE
jgi:hypothetical protein